MLIGRITKDSADRRRVIVDFEALEWLDEGEVISSFTPPTVAVEPAGVSSSPPTTLPPPPIPDATPMQIVNAAIQPSGTQVIMFATVGTVGLTYRVIFTATGSTSTRVKQVDFLVYVRE